MQKRDTTIHDAEEQALTWFVRMQSGQARQEEKEAFAKWLTQSSSHRAEYAKLDGLWSDLEGLVPVVQETSDNPEMVKDPGSDAVLPFQSERRGFSRRCFLAGGAIAASLAGLSITSGWPEFLYSDHYTDKGEIRSVLLEDGSKIVLDADSAINVRYSSDMRLIHLQNGRAYFDVAKDPGRPFVVNTSGGQVRALGTQFVVHDWKDGVRVSVTESSVEVTAPNLQQAILELGQAVTYSDTDLGQVGQTNVDAALAWRNRKLVFEDQPFGQVISDLNRYMPGRIVATSQALLDMRVSGILDLSQPASILPKLSAILPVKITRLTSLLVIIRQS